MIKPSALVLAGLALVGPHAAALQPGDLLIRNGSLIDGTGAAPRSAMSILVIAGRIAAIGPDLKAPDSAAVIDASGMSVLPGLIDSHVHFVYAPGSAYRNDTDETIRELNHQHLRAYVACGVTTVLDAGAFPETVRDIQSWLAAGNPGPRYLTTGPYVRPPGGYGHQRFGTESTPAEIDAKLDLIKSLGGVGVKIGIERVSQPFGRYTSFPPALRDALLNGARQRGLPLYVHAMSEEAQGMALDLDAHAIMHAAMDIPALGPLFASADLSDAFVTRMAQSGVYQLTTLSVFATWPSMYDRTRLDDPMIQLVVPSLELDTARAPDAADSFSSGILAYVAPWTFVRARPWLGSLLFSQSNLTAAVQQGQRNLLKLHRAGVPIVVATDAPSPWPEAIYHFHGPQTGREMEMLVEGGMSSLDVISAATRVPAKMLALDAEIGTIAVGKRADLVIIRGDPVQDIRALRAVSWTVRDGVAKTPQQWMVD